MFSSIINVLEIVIKDGISLEQRGEAYGLLDLIQSFDFTFNLHLMKIFWELQMNCPWHYKGEIKIL